MCVFISPLVFSSISLDLLPERAATLMVYEDVVEIVPGLQGEHTVCVCLYASVCVYSLLFLKKIRLLNRIISLK